MVKDIALKFLSATSNVKVFVLKFFSSSLLFYVYMD